MYNAKAGKGKRFLSVLMCLLMLITSVPLTILPASAAVDNSPRLELNFNKDWKFYLGDAGSGQSTALKDDSWDTVNLPHDFSIIQSFTTSGTDSESGMLPGGTGWYRKKFCLPKEYASRQVVLNFEASYTETYVYVNGNLVASNLYGYNPFSIDITDYITCDGQTSNLVAVKVSNPMMTSRWYSGSGLIGDVTISILNKTHVDLYGTVVTTPNLASSNGADGTTKATVTIANEDSTAKSLTINASIQKKGSSSDVATSSVTGTIESGRTDDFDLTLDVNNPDLWSTDVALGETANLYNLHIEILEGGTVVDEYDTEFGYRWYSFDTNNGFYLNGKNIKINGVCMHHDQGALGAVQEYDAIYRQVSVLKEFGVNSIRTSHNTPSKTLLKICNELGILVLEEFFDYWNVEKNGNSNSFHRYFDTSVASSNNLIGSDGLKWYQYVIEQSVKRDRNDPAVYCWDLGNELQAGEFSNTTLASDMVSVITALDPEDRPITYGNNQQKIVAIDECLDIFGANYYLRNYANTHDSSFASKPFLSTETSSAVTTRGHYSNVASDMSPAYDVPYASASEETINAYDASHVSWGDSAAYDLAQLMKYDWLSGVYVWTGFDYIGEPTPWNNTTYAQFGLTPNSSYFGIVDTAGFEKDSYYLYKSIWQPDTPTAHLVPGTWNQDSLAIDSSGYVDVVVYTNAARVELLNQDGTVIGEATATSNSSNGGLYTYNTYAVTKTSDSCVAGTINYSRDQSLYPIFHVKYSDVSSLSLKAYDASGNDITSSSAGTKSVAPNSAASITAEVWGGDKTMTADDDSFKYIELTAVDANGNFANDYNGTVNISLTGAGKIAGVDNGDPATTEKFQQSSVLTSDTTARITFLNGKALVIVQSTEEAGDVTVTVTPTDSLDAQTVALTSVAETGDELTDEFEEAVDQSNMVDSATVQDQYDLVSGNITSLTAPVTETTYELYTLGSETETTVPDDAYVIANADMTAALNKASTSDTVKITTAPNTATQLWNFTQLENGKYTISTMSTAVTTKYLNLSSSGPSIGDAVQEFVVTVSNGYVTISDGTNYLNFSTTAASASTSSQNLSLYRVSSDTSALERWTPAELISDGTYVLYSTNAALSGGEYSLTNSYTSQSYNKNQAYGIPASRVSISSDGKTLNATAANELTFTKIPGQADMYYIQNPSGEYLTLGAINLSFSSTPFAVRIVQNGTNTINVFLNGTTYALDLIAMGTDNQRGENLDNKFYSVYGDGSTQNQKHTLFKKIEPSSEAKISLYNALKSAEPLAPLGYTTSSYAAFLDALQDAYNVYTSDSSTDEDYALAAQTLNTARGQLVMSDVLAALKNEFAALTPPTSSSSFPDSVNVNKYTASSGDAPVADGWYAITVLDDFNTTATTDDKNRVMANTIPEAGFVNSDSASISDDYFTTNSDYLYYFYNTGTANTYYIYNSDGQYLTIGDNNGSLSLSSTPQEISVVNSDGQIILYKTLPSGSIMMVDYWRGGEGSATNNQQFSTWTKEISSAAENNKFTLYSAKDTSLYNLYNPNTSFMPLENGVYILANWADTRNAWNTTEVDVFTGNTFSLSGGNYVTGETVSGVNGGITQIYTSSDYEFKFTYITSSTYTVQQVSTGKYLKIDSSSGNQVTLTDSYTTLYIKTYTGNTSNNLIEIRPTESSTMALGYILSNDETSLIGDFASWKPSDGQYNVYQALYAPEKSPRNDLYDIIEEAVNIESGSYSTETIQALADAVEAGIEVYNNSAATETEINGAITNIRNAIDNLKLNTTTFKSTLYKYGYTPTGATQQDKYLRGGSDMNTLSYAEMKQVILSSTSLTAQLGAIVDAASGTFSSDDERTAAIDSLAGVYAKLYTLAFTGAPTGTGGTYSTDYYIDGDGTDFYNTFWNIWQKPDSKLDSESSNEGASVQGLFPTTLATDTYLIGMHSSYSDALEYINTGSATDSAGNKVAGLHSNITASVTKGGSSVSVTLPALSDIAVYIPDYFTKQDVTGTDSTYAKYYWETEFPFVTTVNSAGVANYVYDSAASNYTYQASFDDENHSASAVLTMTEGTTGQVHSSDATRGNINGFFPFNNRLDGDNADMTAVEEAIYHFGMSFETEFSLPISGTYADGQDVIFEFSGDDDVLVYIDDVLILENAGLHGGRKSVINFTDKSISYDFVAELSENATTGGPNVVYTYGDSTTDMNDQTAAALSYLNQIATDGQVHTLRFFYLERGSTLSNCKISFNLQKVSDYLSLYPQTYVADFGLQIDADAKTNNIFYSETEQPTYEYVGYFKDIPSDLDTGVSFKKPEASENLVYFENSATVQGSYGTFTLNTDGTFSYKPTTTEFKGSDSIYLLAEITNDSTYPPETVYYAYERILIIPATTVYYEDDFESITYNDGTQAGGTVSETYGKWSVVTDPSVTAAVNQAADIAGDANANIYGYDQNYASFATYSNGSAHKVTVNASLNPNASGTWPTAEFTFAGTGFDIISTTSNTSGLMVVICENVETGATKRLIVDTYYGYNYGQLYADAQGNQTLTVTDIPLYYKDDSKTTFSATPTYYDKSGNVTTAQTDSPAYAYDWMPNENITGDNSLYQIPVIRVQDLEYGTYNVTIQATYSKFLNVTKAEQTDITFDAVRIYNPAGAKDAIADANVSMTYSRDGEANQSCLKLRDLILSEDSFGSTTDSTTSEITPGIVYIDGISANADISKYKNAGPKNEIYIKDSQFVTFEIWATEVPVDIQIGAKAVDNDLGKPTLDITAIMPETSTQTSTYNTVNKTIALNSATDLYYSIIDIVGNSTNTWTRETVGDTTYYKSPTIILRNTGDAGSILSMTNIKWTFATSGALGVYNPVKVAAQTLTPAASPMMLSRAVYAMNMLTADLSVDEDDITVDTTDATAGESVTITVTTSTDVSSLVIKDADGNVITPEAIESFVETIDDEQVKQWSVTLSEDEDGTYTYFISGAYENGYTTGEATQITVTFAKPAQESFFDKLIGVFKKLIDFFKKLIEMLKSA